MKTDKIVFAALGALLLMAGVVGAAQTKAPEIANEQAMSHANEQSVFGQDADEANDSLAPERHAQTERALCDGYRNHGDYVSQEAKEEGNASEAARSDIGKCPRDESADNETAGTDDADDEAGKSEARGEERGRSEEARSEHPPRN